MQLARVSALVEWLEYPTPVLETRESQKLHKQLGAEAYYYVMIASPNDIPSDLKIDCKKSDSQT